MAPSGYNLSKVPMLILLVLSPAAQLYAQDGRIGTLLSNASQGSDDSATFRQANPHAQHFITDGATAGHTLTSVVVNSETAIAFTLKVCETDGSGFPTSTCTTLTTSSSFTANADITFNAAGNGMHLVGRTDWTLLFETTSTSDVTIDSTTSGSEDSASLSGWTIDDNFDWQNSGSWEAVSSTESIVVTLRGYAGAPSDPLGVTAGCSPSCSVDTGNRVTLTATPSDPFGTVSYTWSVISGDSGTFESGATGNPVTWRAPDVPGTTRIQVVATDTSTNTATATVTVTITVRTDPGPDDETDDDNEPVSAPSAPALPLAGTLLLAYVLALLARKGPYSR